MAKEEKERRKKKNSKQHTNSNMHNRQRKNYEMVIIIIWNLHEKIWICKQRTTKHEKKTYHEFEFESVFRGVLVQ